MGYESIAPLEWAECELDTIFYGYGVHGEARDRIMGVIKGISDDYARGIQERDARISNLESVVKSYRELSLSILGGRG